MKKRLVIIGLDCATTQLIDSWRQHLPSLNHLISRGTYCKLESTIPPITVPAWACMVTGVTPGSLGFYGFRNRKGYSYDGLSFVTSRSLKVKTVWDILSEAGKDVVVIGVPPSYPPKAVKGCMLSCFLTPSADSPYAYPASLKEELEGVVGEYIFDVRNFRTDDKENLIKQVYELTEQRFAVAKYLLKNKPWDFFMFVEMGPDRIHHGFWKYCDPSHIKYEQGNPYANVIFDYYKFLDSKIGEVLEILDDDISILVVSDHGAKKMDGGICINEWLMQEGYLKVKAKPHGIVRFDKVEVDWEKTKAWAEGGYYGRLFLNVKGREPQGVIEQKDYEKVRDELIEKIESLGDENGDPIGTKVYKPEEIYDEVKGIPPDLIILFGDLYWRSVGSMGFNTIWVHENDTGPDDANHAMEGIFIASHMEMEKVEKLNIIDIAPMILDYFGFPAPVYVQGRSILR
ncbi:MAG: alkaline phosphatase family protein [Candidatus Zixiibacteriota bacterium]